MVGGNREHFSLLQVTVGRESPDSECHVWWRHLEESRPAGAKNAPECPTIFPHGRTYTKYMSTIGAKTRWKKVWCHNASYLHILYTVQYIAYLFSTLAKGILGCREKKQGAIGIVMWGYRFSVLCKKNSLDPMYIFCYPLIILMYSASLHLYMTYCRDAEMPLPP